MSFHRTAIGLLALALVLAGAGGEIRPADAAPTWPFDGVAVGSVATRDGDLDALVRDLSALMPQRNSRSYRDPTATEAMRLRTGVAAADRGELSTAAATLAPLGFRVVRYRDTGTGRSLIVLAQGRAEWTQKRAWGMVVLYRSATKRLVEAPHTLADLHTERVAVSVFRRSRARALLVAGAHRYALPRAAGARWAPADVAHQPAAPFMPCT